jgi:hypothetical protein
MGDWRKCKVPASLVRGVPPSLCQVRALHLIERSCEPAIGSTWCCSSGGANKKMKAPLVWRRDVLRDRFREGFRRRDVLRHPNQPATIVGCVPGRPHRARWREWSHTARADSGQSYLRSCERPVIFRTCLFVHYFSRRVKRGRGNFLACEEVAGIASEERGLIQVVRLQAAVGKRHWRSQWHPRTRG